MGKKKRNNRNCILYLTSQGTRKLRAEDHLIREISPLQEAENEREDVERMDKIDVSLPEKNLIGSN